MDDQIAHPLSDQQCQALRALPLSFNDMLRAAFDQGRQCERHRHGQLHARIGALERELMAALSGAEHEARQADHWKANHDNLVARCALLSQRDDLPVDRLPAYRELVRLQAMFALRDAGPWRYHAAPQAPEFVHRYFLESADFSHDVRLYINGDFADDEQRRLYGETLAAQLNGFLHHNINNEEFAA
ncbi:MAG: hypothetical protein ACXWVD_00370 [Telluria sp.]